jgi:hypothetical protein
MSTVKDNIKIELKEIKSEGMDFVKYRYANS